MTCREALEKKGVKVLEVHPEGCEFICTGTTAIGTALESLDFWDYTSPLSCHTLRPPWWTGGYDPDDENFYLVMGDPDQEV
jgi:hypothetical protein